MQMYTMKCINRAILVNLHHRPLKLSSYKKVCSHGNSVFSSPHPLDFNILVIFSSKKDIKFKLTFICLLDNAYEAPLANNKMECQRWPEEPLILGWSGTQYVAMVTKLQSLYCGAHLVESNSKESIKHLAQIGCDIFHHIWSKFGCSVWHQLAHLHILKLKYFWNEKRYLDKVKTTFILIQTTLVYVVKCLDKKDAMFII